MTELLSQAMDRVNRLPNEAQDDVARALLKLLDLGISDDVIEPDDREAGRSFDLSGSRRVCRRRSDQSSMAALRPLTIRYLPPAEEDIKAIADYIHARNPGAAIRVRKALLGNLAMLATFPGLGVRQSRHRLRKWVGPGSRLSDLFQC
ncbi:MAG: hypothetical protein NVSMB26_22670 [Beijerinckiaceae bacterium]